MAPREAAIKSDTGAPPDQGPSCVGQIHRPPTLRILPSTLEQNDDQSIVFLNGPPQVSRKDMEVPDWAQSLKPSDIQERSATRIARYNNAFLGMQELIRKLGLTPEDTI
jgi:hypothetical protein